MFNCAAEQQLHAYTRIAYSSSAWTDGVITGWITTLYTPVLIFELGTHVSRVVGLSRASRVFHWVLRFSSLRKIDLWCMCSVVRYGSYGGAALVSLRLGHVELGASKNVDCLRSIGNKRSIGNVYAL